MDSDCTFNSKTFSKISPELWASYTNTAEFRRLAYPLSRGQEDSKRIYSNNLTGDERCLLETLATLEVINEHDCGDLRYTLMNIVSLREDLQRRCAATAQNLELALILMQDASSRDSVLALGRILSAEPLYVQRGQLLGEHELKMPDSEKLACLKEELRALFEEDEFPLGAVSVLTVPSRFVDTRGKAKDFSYCIHVQLPSIHSWVSYLPSCQQGAYRIASKEYGYIVCINPVSREYLTCSARQFTGGYGQWQDQFAQECVLDAFSGKQTLQISPAGEVTLAPLARKGWELLFEDKLQSQVHGVKRVDLNFVRCTREGTAGAYDACYEARDGESLAYISKEGQDSEKIALRAPSEATLRFFFHETGGKPLSVYMRERSYHIDFRTFRLYQGKLGSVCAIALEARIAKWLHMRGFLEVPEAPRQSDIQVEGLMMAAHGAALSMIKHCCGATLYDFLKNENLLENRERIASSVVIDGCVCRVSKGFDNDPFLIRSPTLNHLILQQPAENEFNSYKLNTKALFRRVIDPMGLLGCEISPSTITEGSEACKVADINGLGMRLYFAPNGSETEFMHIYKHQADDRELWGRSIVIITPDGSAPGAYAKEQRWYDKVVSMKELLKNAIEGGTKGLHAPVTQIIGTGRTSGKDDLIRVWRALKYDEIDWKDISITLKASSKVHVEVPSKKLRLRKPINKVSFTTPTDAEERKSSASYDLLKCIAYNGSTILVGKNMDKKTRQKQIERLGAQMQMFFSLPRKCYEVRDDGSYAFKFKIEIDPELQEEMRKALSKAKDEAAKTGLEKATGRMGSNLSAYEISELIGEAYDSDSTAPVSGFQLKELEGKKAQGFEATPSSFDAPIED